MLVSMCLKETTWSDSLAADYILTRRVKSRLKKDGGQRDERGGQRDRIEREREMRGQE